MYTYKTTKISCYTLFSKAMIEKYTKQTNKGFTNWNKQTKTTYIWPFPHHDLWLEEPDRWSDC